MHLLLIVFVAFIVEAEHISLGHVWHVEKVDRAHSWLRGVQQNELQLLTLHLHTLNLFICQLLFSMTVTSPASTPPQSNALYPCHRPLLHLSHWCIGSLQKVTTLGLLTPGFRDSFAHPTCLPPVVAQHFTPIPLRPRLSSSLIEWKALAVLLWPGLISLARGSFSCSL